MYALCSVLQNRGILTAKLLEKWSCCFVDMRAKRTAIITEIIGQPPV